MALSKQEREQLAALQARENEPDEPEDFEIYIQNDNGTIRLPYSKAKKLLAKMGLDLEDVVPEGKGVGDEGEEGDEDEDEELDEDGNPVQQPQTRGKTGKAYWKK